LIENVRVLHIFGSISETDIIDRDRGAGRYLIIDILGFYLRFYRIRLDVFEVVHHPIQNLMSMFFEIAVVHFAAP
jgi:hypothetical protein